MVIVFKIAQKVIEEKHVDNYNRKILNKLETFTRVLFKQFSYTSNTYLYSVLKARIIWKLVN